MGKYSCISSGSWSNSSGRPPSSFNLSMNSLSGILWCNGFGSVLGIWGALLPERNRCVGAGRDSLRSCLASSKDIHSPILWPKNAKGLSENDRITWTSSLTIDDRRADKGSLNLVSLPGSCTAHISMFSGKYLCHVLKAEIPPPPYGKQKRRITLCGLGFWQNTQSLLFV